MKNHPIQLQGLALPLKNVDGHDITASQALAEPAKPE